MENIRKKTLRKKYFEQLLKEGPISWSLIRMTELEVLSQVKFKKPILEIACGDGTFSQLLFKKNGFVDYAIDLSAKEIHKAKQQKVFKKVQVADARSLPFKAETFNTVFSNGSLEHFDNLDKVLGEISRVLKINGELIITVPSDKFSKNLSFNVILSKLGFKKAATNYSTIINAAFAHKNLWTPNVWSKKLKKTGLTMTSFQEYNSRYNIWLHEFFFLSAIPSIIYKKFSGDFFIFKKFRKYNSKMICKLMTPLIDLNKEENFGSILIVAKKNG